MIRSLKVHCLELDLYTTFDIHTRGIIFIHHMAYRFIERWFAYLEIEYDYGDLWGYLYTSLLNFTALLDGIKDANVILTLCENVAAIYSIGTYRVSCKMM